MVTNVLVNLTVTCRIRVLDNYLAPQKYIMNLKVFILMQLQAANLKSSIVFGNQTHYKMMG